MGGKERVRLYTMDKAVQRSDKKTLMASDNENMLETQGQVVMHTQLLLLFFSMHSLPILTNSTYHMHVSSTSACMPASCKLLTPVSLYTLHAVPGQNKVWPLTPLKIVNVCVHGNCTSLGMLLKLHLEERHPLLPLQYPLYLF